MECVVAKQVIVMRTDLGMRKGKMIAQGAHASLGVILGMMTNYSEHSYMEKRLIIHNDSPLDKWLNGIFTKICVRVDSEEQLLDVYADAHAARLPVKLIEDAGKTEFNGVPTYTCLAIGPANAEDIDKITGELKLL